MKKLLLTVLAALFVNAIWAQTNITGIVSDDTGEPLIGVSVLIKGTQTGVATDLEGKYSIEAKPNSILLFSSIGSISQEIPVNGRTQINVTLKSDSQNLDDVIVVAYGTVKKGSYSGAATTVRGETIKDAPKTGFEQALVGAMPGVQVSQTSGQPGATPEIRVRGISSFNAGNNPLYVVDGIPVVSGDLSQGNLPSNAMSFLNPNDIENITVLKDAAAASLYGSRAANGVILITTKKGKSGKAVSTFRASVGISNFAMDNYPLTNEEQTIMLLRETFVNYGTDTPSAWNKNYSNLNAYVDAMQEKYYPAKKPGYEYVDWEKQLFKTGVNQNYEYNISAGGEFSKVYASVSYSDIKGVAHYQGMTRISATINAEQKLFNNRVTIGGNFQYTNTDQQGTQDGQSRDNPFYVLKATVTPRWPHKNPDGSYWMESYDGSINRNPVNDMENQINTVKQGRILLKGFAEVEIIKGLKLKSILSFDNSRVDERFGWMVKHVSGTAYGNGYVADSYNKVDKLVSSTTLNYNKTFGSNHNISALLGWESEQMKQQYSRVAKTDFANFAMTSTYLAATVKEAGTLNNTVNMLSAFGSLSYDYKNKYYLTGTYRRDGSSRLGPQTRWGAFWSVSGSWRISNEKFLKDVSWINDLKLRASYGTSGTLPSSYYGYQSLFEYGTYGADNASYLKDYADPQLTWEKNKTWNIALDFAFWNRFSFTADYYQRTTKDLLLDASIPSITGFSSTLKNIGSMLNKGIELAVNVDIIKGEQWQWGVGVNWSSNNNKILSLSKPGEIITSSPFIRTEGYSYYQFYLREYAGVDPQTGKVMYVKNAQLPDGSLDKTIVNTTSGVSSTILEGKTSIPKGFGGLTSNLTWKNLSLNLAFAYSYGAWVFDRSGDKLETDGQYPYKNMSISQLDRWQKPGDITNVPRRTLYPQGGYYDSSRALHKSDYLRLKSAVLSYTLPSHISQKLYFRNARVYLSGSNLFTITGLHFDPEGPINGYSNLMLPPLRTFQLGIEISI